jgi:hypothetical protein
MRALMASIWGLTTACVMAPGGFAEGVADPDPDEVPDEVPDGDPLEADGWTLLLISADDGQDTWTWAARDLYGPGGAMVGSLDRRDRDLRSPAIGEVVVGELLFVHRPSAITARYLLPGAAATLANHLGGGDADCEPEAIPLAGGTLEDPAGALCDTGLYLNPADLDGLGCDLPEPHRSDAWGPAWSVGGNDGCPLDDVGETGSLGPASLEDPTVEYGLAEPAIGFGRALGLNTGQAGSGQNRMEVYAR